MQNHLIGQVKIKSAFLKSICTASLFLLSNSICLAGIVIHGNQVINTTKHYDHVSLDLTDGRFTLNTGAVLKIENSTIDVTISPTNPYFILLNNGQLILNNNIVHVKSSGITPDPNTKSAYQLIRIQNGYITIAKNTFSIDTDYSVGLLETAGVSTTTGFNINSNTINHFHGGFYLVNTNNAKIVDNTFNNVSFANIFNMGNLSNFNRNIFSFPGNLKFGNALNIVNSDGLTISDNIISSSSNDSIIIMGSQNVFMDNNKITDGQAYAINILTPTLAEMRKNSSLSHFSNRKLKFLNNDNILISNSYFSQNKYGLTGGVIDKLIVTNNTFIQRFIDNGTRQYWTNNDNLLSDVSNLLWFDNEYKEAFTQDITGDNTDALKFVTFPAHGGVSIP